MATTYPPKATVLGPTSFLISAVAANAGGAPKHSEDALALMFASQSAQAQTYTVLHNFTGAWTALIPQPV